MTYVERPNVVDSTDPFMSVADRFNELRRYNLFSVILLALGLNAVAGSLCLPGEGAISRWLSGVAIAFISGAIALTSYAIRVRQGAKGELLQRDLSFQSVVNSIGDAICGCDLTGKFIFYNLAARDLLGVDAPDSPTDTWFQHFGTYYPDMTTPYPTDELPILQALAGRATDNVEMFVKNPRRPEGVFVSVTGRPIYGFAGKVLGSAIVVRDISESKKFQDQLIASKRALEEKNFALEVINSEVKAFSYSVSHDLRAPVRSIIGFSELVLKRFSGNLDAEGLDYLNRVNNAGVRLGQLIDGLLSLSRLSRGNLNKVEVDLSEIAAAVMATMQAENPSQKVDFRGSPGVMVYGDSALLQSLMTNLLGNAWKFSRRNPSAIIEFGTIAPQAGQPTTYFIKDNGAGFNMQYYDKLFSIFQRLHANSEFEGNGIGLATVQRIVQSHGGTVWAESKLGEGATFFFTLEPNGERK